MKRKRKEERRPREEINPFRRLLEPEGAPQELNRVSTQKKVHCEGCLRRERQWNTYLQRGGPDMATEKKKGVFATIGGGCLRLCSVAREVCTG